jgi:hypothetical protein
MCFVSRIYSAASTFLFLLLFIANPALASGFGIEVLGLNMHVIDSAVQWGERSQRKIDKSGRFVYLPGLEIYWENDLKTNKILNAHAYRFTIANYLDTMNRRSGYAHIGLRWSIPLDKNRNLSIGFGPSLFFRETWRIFPDYEKHQLLLESNNFLPGYEYMWLPFGDIDYQHKISKDIKLVLSILPAIPYSILFSVGGYWEIGN